MGSHVSNMLVQNFEFKIVVCLTQVAVKGMHCSSCSSAVENALKAHPGVQSASVALLKETAEVRSTLYHSYTSFCVLPSLLCDKHAIFMFR